MKLMRIAAIAAALVLAGAGNWNTARAQSEPSPEAMAAARDLAGLISQDTIKDMATRLTAQIKNKKAAILQDLKSPPWGI